MCSVRNGKSFAVLAGLVAVVICDLNLTNTWMILRKVVHCHLWHCTTVSVSTSASLSWVPEGGRR